MATVTAGMTVSLDGFAADPQGSASRLYSDLADLQGTDYMNAAIEQTGAVVMGRRTFEMGDPDSYVGNYEFQVPIFVVTHHPPVVPPKQDEHLTFTFVTEGVDTAIEQAKAAAADKVVQVPGGAGVIQQLLGAGLVDELRLDVMPVVLGGGLRLLENLDPERLRLEKLDVHEIGARTSLGFRIVNRAGHRVLPQRASSTRHGTRGAHARSGRKRGAAPAPGETPASRPFRSSDGRLTRRSQRGESRRAPERALRSPSGCRAGWSGSRSPATVDADRPH